MARINVADYGAVSGGNEDDNRVAFQAAADALHPLGGDELYVPNGFYYASRSASPYCMRFNGKSGFRYLHESRDNAIIAMTPTDAMDDDPFGNSIAVWQMLNCHNFQFDTFQIEGSKDNPNGPTEYYDAIEHHRAFFVESCTNGTWFNFDIRNMAGDGIQFYNSCYDHEVYNFLIEWNQRDGITLSPTVTDVARIVIRDGTIRGCSNQQIDNEHGPAHDIEIYNNHLEYALNVNSIGLVIAGAGKDGTAPSLRWNVHDNYVRGAIRFTWTSDSVIRNNTVYNDRDLVMSAGLPRVSAIELERVQFNNLVADNIVTQTQTTTPNVAGIYLNGTAGGGASRIALSGNTILVTYASSFGIRADSFISMGASGNIITGAGSTAAGYYGIRVRSAVNSRDVESVHIAGNTITGFGTGGVGLFGNVATPDADILSAKIWANKFFHGGSQTVGIALNPDTQAALQAGLVAENAFGAGVTTPVTAAPEGVTIATSWSQSDGRVPLGFLGVGGFL